MVGTITKIEAFVVIDRFMVINLIIFELYKYNELTSDGNYWT